MSLVEFIRRVRAESAPRKRVAAARKLVTGQRVVVAQRDRNRRGKREAEMLEATRFAQMNCE